MRSGTLAPRSAADLSSVLILAEVPDYGAMPSRITVANAQVPNRASLSAAEDSCTSRLNEFQEICYGRRGRLAMRLAARGGRPLRSIASANFIGASLIAAENSCVYRRPLIAKDSCASRIIAEMSEPFWLKAATVLHRVQGFGQARGGPSGLVSASLVSPKLCGARVLRGDACRGP